MSCDTGLQYRHRRCLKCGQGHNKEMRKCNDFPCDGKYYCNSCIVALWFDNRFNKNNNNDCLKVFRYNNFGKLNLHTGVMELVAPGDRVRTVGGKLNGSENGFSLLDTVGFSNTFSLLITLRVQPKVSDQYILWFKNYVRYLGTIYYYLKERIQCTFK